MVILECHLFYFLDVNECRVSSPCQHNCTNTIGGYQCDCSAGYIIVGDFCEG